MYFEFHGMNSDTVYFRHEQAFSHHPDSLFPQVVFFPTSWSSFSLHHFATSNVCNVAAASKLLVKKTKQQLYYYFDVDELT